MLTAAYLESTVTVAKNGSTLVAFVAVVHCSLRHGERGGNAELALPVADADWLPRRSPTTR